MFSAAGGDRGRRRLVARECAPISLLKRETAAPGQRETQGNPFDWVPPHPLLNDTDQGACGPPILDYTPRMGTAALSEAGSAEREAGPYDNHLRKPHPCHQMRGSTISIPTDLGAPGRRPSIYRGTVSLDPRFAQT